MNHQEVRRLIEATHHLWPTVPFATTVGADMVRTWQVVLADIPVGAAEAMLADRSRAGDLFPPAPGVIAAAVLAVIARARGDAAPGADEAWAEAMAVVRARGWYAGEPIHWSHGAVAAVARSIGWDELCHGEPMVTRAHWMKLYPDAARRIEGERRLVTTLDTLGMQGVLPALDAVLGDGSGAVGEATVTPP